jgi:hypothetical protein
MTRFPAPLRRHDPVGGAEDRRQPEINEIDPGDAERDVAVEHHPFIQETVEQVEHRVFGRVEHLVHNRERLGRWNVESRSSSHGDAQS